MGWPSKIYCATKTLGVYYTSNFVDPGTQPIWATVNGGLPATDVRQFALDPFAPTTKQYLLLEATRDLYRRDSGGNWAAILTSDQARAFTIDEWGSIIRFHTDRLVPGRIWIIFNGGRVLVPGVNWGSCWAMYSDDWGATWAAATMIAEDFPGGYSTHSVASWGNTVFVSWNSNSNFLISCSTNKGAAWTAYGTSLRQPNVCLNPLQPDRVYHQRTVDGVALLTTAGVQTDLVAGLYFDYSNIWFSAVTAAHHRIVGSNSDTKVTATTDSWATKSASGNIDPAPISIAPWSGTDEDQMIVGLTLDHPNHKHHIIGVLYGEADTTAVGIAGTNCDTAPFADSIPDTCGGLAVGGIVAVEEAVTVVPVPDPDDTIDIPGNGTVTLGGTANVQAVTMPGYTGDARGEPLPGDRSAWKTDTEPHGQLHAQDITHEEAKYHLPFWDAANGNAPIFNSTSGYYENGDVLTPAEHTAIGDGAPHHAAVTLGAGSDAALVLAGQELTLTLPAVSLQQTAVAAVILVAGDYVNLYNDGGTLKARFADCSLLRPADGYVLAGYAIGATATVYLEGHNTSLAGLTIGDMLYLSTIGDATATAPTTIGYIVQPIGQAFTATKAAFHREHTILLAT